MSTVDYIAIAAVALLLGSAIVHMIRAKSRGEKCIGCPYAKECGGKCDTSSNDTQNKKYQN